VCAAIPAARCRRGDQRFGLIIMATPATLFSSHAKVNPMDTIHKWLIDNRITEVEVLVPDMTGNARGKFVPADKFMKQESLRLPEGILAQAVNGDYPDDYWELVDPRDRDMNLRADPEHHAGGAVGQ
jgi:hypothetical protein